MLKFWRKPLIGEISLSSRSVVHNLQSNQVGRKSYCRCGWKNFHGLSNKRSRRMIRCKRRGCKRRSFHLGCGSEREKRLRRKNSINKIFKKIRKNKYFEALEALIEIMLARENGLLNLIQDFNRKLFFKFDETRLTPEYRIANVRILKLRNIK